MRRAPHSQEKDGKHRHSRPACGRELGDELAKVGAEIDDPVVKLRYLRGALDQAENYSRQVQRVPLPPLRRALYRWRGLEALEPILDDEIHREAIQARTHAARRRARLWLGGAVATGLLLMPALVASVVLSVDKSRIERVPRPLAGNNLPAPRLQHRDLRKFTGDPVAEPVPDDAGVAPGSIWLVDQDDDWEVYSNGLRIETRFAVLTVPRSYRIHHKTDGLRARLHSRPAGILFHTSESDLWPLEADYGAQLRASSEALLRYVQRTQSYNYLIDRFGRVYRVIDDESRATHAGHAIWANGADVYLNLNDAFIGVAFESRWEGGHTLPITQAQLVAGRNLTNYLRQRFSIAPQMCVTHGLTSVSPRNHLIGYHLDWARGFPFAAFGLPDQYQQPLPSVALFGFGHDRAFERAMGELWPGLRAAERDLRATARARAISAAALRQERRSLYEEWMKQVRAADAALPAPAQQRQNRQTVNR